MRTRTSSKENIFRSFAMLLSSPHSLWGSSSETIAEGIGEVIYILHSKNIVVSKQSGNDTLDESTVEREDGLRVRYFALSTKDAITLILLKLHGNLRD